MATRLKEWMLLCWKAVRQLSGDDAYDAISLIMQARHADRSPLSRRNISA